MNAARTNSRLGDVSAWRRVRPVARTEQTALSVHDVEPAEKRKRDAGGEPRARMAGVSANNVWRLAAVEIVAPRGLRADEGVKIEWRKAYAAASRLSGGLKGAQARPKMDARA